MHVKRNSHWPTAMMVAALVLGAGALHPAAAHDDGHWDGHWDGHHGHRWWNGRYWSYYAPPVVVAAPPVVVAPVYAPPPVYYAPPPVYVPPSVNIVVPFSFR